MINGSSIVNRSFSTAQLESHPTTFVLFCAIIDMCISTAIFLVMGVFCFSSSDYLRKISSSFKERTTVQTPLHLFLDWSLSKSTTEYKSPPLAISKASDDHYCSVLMSQPGKALYGGLHTETFSGSPHTYSHARSLTHTHNHI